MSGIYCADFTGLSSCEISRLHSDWGKMSLLGKPIVVLPYGKPGCLARLGAFLRLWLVRLLWAGAWFAVGLAVGECSR